MRPSTPRRFGLAAALALHLAAPAQAARPAKVYEQAELRATRAEPCATADVVTTAPHPALTGILGVLRREQTAADAVRGLRGFPVAQRVYGAHVRFAREFEGERYYLVPFKRADFITRPARAACRRVIVRAVRRIDARAVPYARRRAAREGRLARLAPDAVEVLDSSFVVGQGYTARKIGSDGGWGAIGRQVSLLLPDTVARVRSHHGGFVADAVPESNLAIFVVPKGHGLEPQLVEWFDASGNVIRRVRRRDAVIID